MGEYTPQIEAQIARLLAQRGSATPDDLAGVDEVDGARFLRAYADAHAAEGIILDGSILTASAPYAPAADSSSGGPLGQPVSSPPPSAPPGAYEPSVFPDAPVMVPEPPRRAKVPIWLWILPVLFSLLGGVVAWAVAKDKDPIIARNLLITGFVVFGLNLFIGFGLGSCAAGSAVSSFDSAPTNTAWPSSAAGKPTLYYFGSAG